tara:strand:+ start:47 stop:316 length:270 start_codon:yes stop_codon:yes gene_type:complete
MTNEQNILSKFASRIVDKGMTVPVLFFLESTKYVSFIGSQMMVFFGPILTSFINSEKYYNFSELLEDRNNIDYLLNEIERIDLEVQRNK